MGNGSSSCLTVSVPNPYITTISPCKSKSLSSSIFIPTVSTNIIPQNFLLKIPITMSNHSSPSNLTVKCGGGVEIKETQDENTSNKPIFETLNSSPDLLQKLIYDALVWTSLHGLVVGHKSVQKSGTVPGVGMVHAPFALLPMSFPKSHWEQACELAPVFNELVDRVSLDGKFLQDSLSRNLLNHYEGLGLDSKRVPANGSVNQFAEALALAWKEYNNPRAVVVIVAQPEETNMYDQHWLSFVLKEKHGVTMIRKTLREVDEQGELQPDGTLIIGGQAVAVIYFRAGYTPNDYPSESEWRARLLMEQSLAVKCPSISYHLTGTKKIQQELAKPGVLERFMEDKDDIAKLRKCFAGLWSLDDTNVVKDAIERPESFVLKPQREGGGNNIYGKDLSETLLKLQKENSEELSAYILMQRIFPTSSQTFLIRDGICHQDQAISELGIYGAYLRSKGKVILNEQSGYLMRTKVSSSDEGGVAAGFAVLDSVYLT
ncbi:glutathione synthetase, chloroplastic-like isoform X2 [Papaver somniferum]|uniref:glutathione synthetase, chloroplastic-like isoform X2 n=1 Tax=Papaver somniferum TaxID=3469 RepID=UPI000E7059D2|nr:glutathione synthetase, chloroplastic-like isoform X2 [Papaver somniferum]